VQSDFNGRTARNPRGRTGWEFNLPVTKHRSSENRTIWYRREFLSLVGWTGVLGALAAWSVSIFRLLFPRVLFEPPTVFTAGFPESLAPGEVNTRFLESKRVWLVRDREGVYALLARCTHLGCTPRWLESEGKFKCPCHGSGFTKEGINFEGPAPTPLRRLKITLADDGQMLVDKSREFKAESKEWDDPEAFLPV